MKRILDCHASDFKAMNRDQLLEAIGSAEGRTIACETIRDDKESTKSSTFALNLCRVLRLHPARLPGGP